MTIMPNPDAAARTRALARVVGPYLVVTAAALFARQDTIALVFPAFMQDGPLVLATGAFTLMAGLTIIALHHHWTGASAIAVSLVGVAAALKGAMLMVAPTLGAAATAAVVRAPAAMLVVAALMLILGAWLSFVGWRAIRSPQFKPS
jgi:hypothetical protein